MRRRWNDANGEARYDPIQKFGPQDCVASINAIIEKMDFLVETKNQAAIQELKAIFGLEDLQDIRDFAMTIAFPRMSAHLPPFCSVPKITCPTLPLILPFFLSQN